MPKNVGKSKPFTGSQKKDYPHWWSCFRTLRILWLRPQNPKNPKNRTTDKSRNPNSNKIPYGIGTTKKIQRK